MSPNIFFEQAFVIASLSALEGELAIMDDDFLIKDNTPQSGKTVGYQNLYVNQLNFCISQAKIDQLKKSSTIFAAPAHLRSLISTAR